MRDETSKVVPLRAAPAPAPAAAPPAPAPRRTRWPWVAALLVVLAALGFVLGRDRVRPADRPVAVGVMDVRAKTAGVPDWMRTLTRDSLNTVLSRVPAVRVFSRQKIDFLREKRGLTEIEAAEQLGMTQLRRRERRDRRPAGDARGRGRRHRERRAPRHGARQGRRQAPRPGDRARAARPDGLGVHPTAEELKAIVADRQNATVEAYGSSPKRSAAATSLATAPPASEPRRRHHRRPVPDRRGSCGAPRVRADPRPKRKRDPRAPPPLGARTRVEAARCARRAAGRDGRRAAVVARASTSRSRRPEGRVSDVDLSSRAPTRS